MLYLQPVVGTAESREREMTPKLNSVRATPPPPRRHISFLLFCLLRGVKNMSLLSPHMVGWKLLLEALTLYG